MTTEGFADERAIEIPQPYSFVRTAADDGSDSKEYTEMLLHLHSPSYKVVDVLKDHNEPSTLRMSQRATKAHA